MGEIQDSSHVSLMTQPNDETSMSIQRVFLQEIVFYTRIQIELCFHITYHIITLNIENSGMRLT